PTSGRRPRTCYGATTAWSASFASPRVDPDRVAQGEEDHAADVSGVVTTGAARPRGSENARRAKHAGGARPAPVRVDGRPAAGSGEGARVSRPACDGVSASQ